MNGGSWDAMEDAAEALQKADVSFLLMSAKEGLSVSRCRTNVVNREGLRWMRKRLLEALDSLEADSPE